MAQTTYIPLTWKNMDLSDKKQMKVWQSQLADWANQAQMLLTTLDSANGLAAILNGSGVIQISALSPVSHDFGTTNTNQTIACDGATSVSVRMANNGAANFSITFTHLSNGVPINILAQNINASSRVFLIAATDPSGASYSVFARNGGALVDMGATGISIATNGSLWLGGNSVPANIFLGTA